MTMKKYLSAKLDLGTVITRDIASFADVMFPLGFVGEENCTSLPEKVQSRPVPSLHFVVDNAYLEGAQFPPEVDEFYRYLKSDGGMYAATFLTDDAQRMHAELTAAGETLPDIHVTIRANTDHGEVKGPAEFHLVAIERDVIPGTHLAFLEHKNPGVLYQPNRYQHPNTADVFDEVVMCMDDEAAADALCAGMDRLNAASGSERCPTGVEKLSIMDSASFCDEFGYAPDPDRSIFCAVVFLVSDMAACRRCVAASGLDWHEERGAIYVDAREKISLVFCFKPKTV